MISGHTLAKNLRQWGVVFGQRACRPSPWPDPLQPLRPGRNFPRAQYRADRGRRRPLARAGARFYGGWRPVCCRAGALAQPLGADRAQQHDTGAVHRTTPPAGSSCATWRFIEMYNLPARAAARRHADARIAARGVDAGTFAGDPGTLCRRTRQKSSAGRHRYKDLRDEERPHRLVDQPAAARRRLGGDPHRRDRAARRRKGARHASPARGAPHRDRCRYRVVPRPGGKCHRRCRPERRSDEAGGQDPARHVGSHVAARRRRGARLQRGFGQCRDRGGRRRRTVGLDQRNQPQARADQRCRTHRGCRRDRHQRRHRGARARRAAHRRRGQAHPGHRRTDQSARAQRHHRGGARRRSRTRLCRRGVGGEVAGGADRQGDRRNHQGNLLGAKLDRRRGRRHPRDHPAHAGHQRAYFRSGRRHRAAGTGDRRDFAQCGERRGRCARCGVRARRRRLPA